MTKGSLAIADQGVFAVSNFLLNILLARWLAPGDYGRFALVYSVFLLFLLVHSAFFATPLLVFGQGKYRERFPEYLGILLRCHVALTLPGSAILLVVVFLLGKVYSPDAVHSFFALAAAAPFILLLWLLRRAFYALLDPVWSAASGMAYLVILVGGTAMLHRAGLLSPSTGVLTMAAASVITSVLMLIRLRPAWAADSATIRAVVIDHWSYGKWVAAGAGPNWVTENIYFIVLPASFGLAEVGALKALLNLSQPASQSVSALGVLLTPVFVRELKAKGSGGMAKTMKVSTLLLFSLSVAYLAFLWEFRSGIFHLLYGNKFSARESWPVLAVGLIPVAQSLSNVAGAALGAIEKPKLGFWADSWSAVFSLVVGVPLTLWLGVRGAPLGIALAYTLIGLLSFFFYIRSISCSSSVAELPAAALQVP